MYQEGSKSQEEGPGEETIPRSIIFQFIVGYVLIVQFIVVEQQRGQASKGRGGWERVGC